MNAKAEKTTLVEEGTELEGSLKSTCPILVRGRVEGQIKAPALTVSASGAVHGKVQVDELLSEGELSGELDAGTVELSGKVRDKTVLRAKSLSVKLSSDDNKIQIVFGECELSVGDPPPKVDEVG